jgi:FMN phosphatase YigB (HAD superfamily)
MPQGVTVDANEDFTLYEKLSPEMRAMVANATINVGIEGIRRFFSRYDLDEIGDMLPGYIHALTRQECEKAWHTFEVLPRGIDGKLPEDFLRYRQIHVSSRTARAARDAKRYARYLSRRSCGHIGVAKSPTTPALR